MLTRVLNRLHFKKVGFYRPVSSTGVRNVEGAAKATMAQDGSSSKPMPGTADQVCRSIQVLKLCNSGQWIALAQSSVGSWYKGDECTLGCFLRANVMGRCPGLLT